MLRQVVRGTRAVAPAGFAGVWNLSDSLQFLGLQKGSAHAEVYAIDPRLVLRPEELQKVPSLEQVTTLIQVPRELVAKLSKGVPELADMDEPGNAWYFGDRAEIFDYKLVGEFPTQSGFAAFIQREVLEAVRRGEPAKKLPSWEEFLQLTSDQVAWPHRKTPFLFAGRMVEASMAALYTLEKEGRVTGVLVSSESSGGAD